MSNVNDYSQCVITGKIVTMTPGMIPFNTSSVVKRVSISSEMKIGDIFTPISPIFISDDIEIEMQIYTLKVENINDKAILFTLDVNNKSSIIFSWLILVNKIDKTTIFINNNDNDSNNTKYLNDLNLILSPWLFKL